jgi:RimJ/RimL family protein N-acetyltransferase
MASVLLRCAFELDGAARVDLLCPPENHRSVALARRLGFTLEGRLRERQLSASHTRGDLISYSMLAREYPSTPASRLPLQAWDFLGRPMMETTQGK